MTVTAAAPKGPGKGVAHDDTTTKEQTLMHVLALLGSTVPKPGCDRGCANLAHAILGALGAGEETAFSVAAQFAGVVPARFNEGEG